MIDWLTDVTIASDHTLYAQWTANEYTVTYDSNKPAGASADVDGETANSTHTYDLTADLAINGFALTGWTFDCWNTADNATGTAYTDGEEVLNLTAESGGEVTLYAIWTANT